MCVLRKEALKTACRLSTCNPESTLPRAPPHCRLLSTVDCPPTQSSGGPVILTQQRAKHSETQIASFPPAPPIPDSSTARSLLWSSGPGISCLAGTLPRA